MSDTTLADASPTTTKTLATVAVTGAVLLGFAWGVKKAGTAIVRKLHTKDEN